MTSRVKSTGHRDALSAGVYGKPYEPNTQIVRLTPPPSSQGSASPTESCLPRTPIMETTFDLPDSTDWIATTLPAFEALEAALRCEMCKEFYSNPVITSCSHTFCSICIRRNIAADGKCPSCRTALSSDKLAPNIAVREVVMRFQEARPKALELARIDKEQENRTDSGNNRKRKIEETDIEDGEDTRQTRSRQTRRSRRNAGSSDAPLEIPDSGDDGDADFLPEGIAKCPICNEAMKQELVFNHLDVCTGQSSSQGRSTRSKYVGNCNGECGDLANTALQVKESFPCRIAKTTKRPLASTNPPIATQLRNDEGRRAAEKTARIRDTKLG